MEQQGWLYFSLRNTDGSVRLVVRRNGPDIDLLTPSGWQPRPSLLPRFYDGALDQETPDAARAAAKAKDLPWD